MPAGKLVTVSSKKTFTPKFKKSFKSYKTVKKSKMVNFGKSSGNFLKMPIVNWPLPTKGAYSLRYVDSTTISSSAGATNNLQYNLSSLYDPDYLYVGHQPYGWDQISGLFNAYCVFKVDVTIKMIACTVPMKVNICPKFNNTSAGSSFSLEMEKSYSSNYLVGTEGKTVKLSYYLPKLAGVSQEWWRNNCSSTPGASPSVSTYLNIMSRPADTVSTATLAVDCQLRFQCLLTQAIGQNQS